MKSLEINCRHFQREKAILSTGVITTPLWIWLTFKFTNVFLFTCKKLFESSSFSNLPILPQTISERIAETILEYGSTPWFSTFMILSSFWIIRLTVKLIFTNGKILFLETSHLNENKKALNWHFPWMGLLRLPTDNIYPWIINFR